MGRKKKHPEHIEDAEKMMKELLDGLVSIWTAERDPELKKVSAELEISPAKVRKLLITAGERDHTTYFSSQVADEVLSLYHAGKSVKEIEIVIGLGYTSVQAYLPHNHMCSIRTESRSCFGLKTRSEGSCKTRKS